MKTKAEGYYIQVKNLNGYPSQWVSLKITHDDTSRFWFGGGTRTRTAIFKTYIEARRIARKQIRIFQKKHSGNFKYVIMPIRMVRIW